MKTKSLILASAVAVLLTGAAIVFKRQRPPTARIPAPDPVTATQEETVTYLASDAFGRLKPEAKQTYLEETRRAHEDKPRPLVPTSGDNTTKAQRDAAFRNMLPILNQVINQRLDAYEGLAPQAQKMQLDLFIDRIQQSQSGGSEAFEPDRFKQILENVDPYTRAKMRKRLPQLEQRMKERGVALPWKPFGFQ